MKTVLDPDIGKCDDCGSVEGKRTAIRRVVRIGGEPVRVQSWLCPACQGS